MHGNPSLGNGCQRLDLWQFGNLVCVGAGDLELFSMSAAMQYELRIRFGAHIKKTA